jgi:hypothetical protein
VVVWRTWAIYQDSRKWLIIPMATWVGSLSTPPFHVAALRNLTNDPLVAGLFELGCDLRTHWAINDLTPSAASVGAETCARADLSSYTLSFVTNIFCTLLIARKAWCVCEWYLRYLTF